MTVTDYKFEGWGGFDSHSVEGQLKWFEYEPKKWNEDDVDVKILYCGICGSDIHTLASGWGDMSELYPQVVGHEIVGVVVKAGSQVEHGIKEGDLVGIGAQCDSCLKCHWCTNDREQYCEQGQIGTYAGIFKRGAGNGDKSYGGYANYWRGPTRFVVPIPKDLDPASAAPMLCGGTTVYSPLKQYGAGTTAKDVGIIGIGGLGHFAVLFAKAMGANVTAITHSDSKADDIKALGASRIITTGDDDAEAVKGHERTLDLIICSSNDPKMPLAQYIKLLRPSGHFVLVGAPETDSLPPISPFVLLMGNIHIAGSAIGSPSDIRDMLEFAAKHNVKPWIKKYPLKDANEAVQDMVAGKARYRYVLVNEENGGEMGEAQV